MNWVEFGRFLRASFLLRVPLLTLFAMAAFGPFALSVAEPLLGNLLDQERNGRYFFLVAFASFLLAFTAISAINLVFAYGRDRLSDENVYLYQRRPIFTFFAGCLPAVVLLSCVGMRTAELPTAAKFLLSALGFVAAVVLILVAKIIQLVLTDPSLTRQLPPFFVFHASALPVVEGFFDFLYKRPFGFSVRLNALFNRGSQWFLEVLRPAGQGYLVDLDPPSGERLKLRPGHVFALCLSGLALACYLAIGYYKSEIEAAPARVPALAYLLLFAIVVCWVLSALAFFLDRYRFPLLWCLAILSVVTAYAPISDHFFRIVRLESPPTGLLTPAQLLRSRLGAGQKRLVFVATAGGGIQAAAWTVQVLTGLEEECKAHTPPCSFRNSVVAISSVSGGSLGTVAYARTYDSTLPPVTPSQALNNAETPALDEVGWGWTNPDVMRAVSPLFWRRYIDRGWALERKWAAVNQLNDTEGGVGDTLLSAWGREAQEGMPALIFNSTIVETGEPIVFTTSDFAHAGNANGLVNFYDIYKDRPGFVDLRVNTAARLSASFPYVGPAARSGEKPAPALDYHFVDGGYYDNYGIGSLLAWLEDALTDPEVQSKISDVLILQIRPFQNESQDKRKSRGWGFQIVAPVVALLSMRDTAQDANDSNELELFGEYFDSQHLNVWTARFDFGGDGECAKSPLSWKLSAAQKGCIADGWSAVKGRNAAPQGSASLVDCVTSYLSNGTPTCRDAGKAAVTSPAWKR